MSMGNTIITKHKFKRSRWIIQKEKNTKLTQEEIMSLGGPGNYREFLYCQIVCIYLFEWLKSNQIKFRILFRTSKPVAKPTLNISVRGYGYSQIT